MDYKELISNTDWMKDCMLYHHKVLLGNKSHWCNDWDGLPIDETCKEFQYCLCSFE